MASDWSIRTKGSLFVNEPTPNINEKSIPAHSSDLIIYPELDFLGGIWSPAPQRENASGVHKCHARLQQSIFKRFSLTYFCFSANTGGVLDPK